MQKKDNPEIVPLPDIPVEPLTPSQPEIMPKPEKVEPLPSEPGTPYPEPEIQPDKEREF